MTRVPNTAQSCTEEGEWGRGGNGRERRGDGRMGGRNEDNMY